MSKKYCQGIDCAWCQEKSDPCIYKEANRLEEENERIKTFLNWLLKQQYYILPVGITNKVKLLLKEDKGDN